MCIVTQVSGDWGTIEHYDECKGLYQAGVGMAVAGSVAGVLGIPLMVAGKSKATLVKIDF